MGSNGCRRAAAMIRSWRGTGFEGNYRVLSSFIIYYRVYHGFHSFFSLDVWPMIMFYHCFLADLPLKLSRLSLAGPTSRELGGPCAATRLRAAAAGPWPGARRGHRGRPGAAGGGGAPARRRGGGAEGCGERRSGASVGLREAAEGLRRERKGWGRGC